MGIADIWNLDGHGVLDVLKKYAANPQLVQLRNSLPPGHVYFNDADQLMVGNNGLSHSQAEAQMGMWVMLASPLIMSTELRNSSLRQGMKEILLNKEVLALAD